MQSRYSPNPLPSFDLMVPKRWARIRVIQITGSCQFSIQLWARGWVMGLVQTSGDLILLVTSLEARRMRPDEYSININQNRVLYFRTPKSPTIIDTGGSWYPQTLRIPISDWSWYRHNANIGILPLCWSAVYCFWYLYKFCVKAWVCTLSYVFTPTFDC
jgi:hypothetical protein